MRYFIQFSYFGTAYHGWQKQPNAITVQSVLEDAFSKLLACKIDLTGAGRTDAGVHARQLFAHFDTSIIEDLNVLVFRLNALLPNDIAVQNIYKVNDDAHARFNATARTYEYWLVQQKNPFLTGAAHFVKHPLDVAKMNKAAAILMTCEDFECFSKSNTDVKTYRCDVRSAVWKWEGTTLVFTITADRFLRNMVRAVVGTLLEIGLGKTDLEEIHAIIASKDRSRAGTSVPAKGLYLTEVSYPPSLFKVYGD